VISLGGPQSANDSHAWIADELALLRAHVDVRRTLQKKFP